MKKTKGSGVRNLIFKITQGIERGVLSTQNFGTKINHGGDLVLFGRNYGNFTSRFFI